MPDYLEMGKKMGMVRLAEVSGRRDNNFDFLRLCAALLVVITHSFPLSGVRLPWWKYVFLGYPPDVVALSAFFVISGFLVSASIENRTLPDYFWSRILRIIPALVAVTLFTAFVIGPLFTELPRRQYLQDPATYSYLWNAIPYSTHFYLPGLFTHLPVAGGVNGSIWTIPIEAFCYVALTAIFLAGRKSTKASAAAAAAVAALLVWNWQTKSLDGVPFFGATFVVQVLTYFLFFLAGSVAWAFRDRIRIGASAGLCVAVAAVLVSLTPIAKAAMYIWLPYLVLCIAYAPKLLGGLMHRLGDVSYGTYLFAFPLQQSIVYLTHQRVTGFALAAVSCVVALMAGWLSWRIIERPALRLKKRPPPAAVELPA